MVVTVTLKVVGEKTMHCGGCERSVTTSLTQLPGVQSATADRTTQEIQIKLDATNITLDTIQTELNDLGYQVKSI